MSSNRSESKEEKNEESLTGEKEFKFATQHHENSRNLNLGDTKSHAELEEAKLHYRLAANKGHSSAQSELGSALLADSLKEKNEEKKKEQIKEGLEWLTKAAAQGNGKAFYSLGDNYENNNSLDSKPDHSKAVEYYLRAAAKGNYEALGALTLAYQYGRGVPQSDAETVKWLCQAIEKAPAKDKRAQWKLRNLSCQLLSRDIPPSPVTILQIATALLLRPLDSSPYSVDDEQEQIEMRNKLKKNFIQLATTNPEGVFVNYYNANPTKISEVLAILPPDIAKRTQEQLLTSRQAAINEAKVLDTVGGKPNEALIGLMAAYAEPILNERASFELYLDNLEDELAAIDEDKFSNRESICFANIIDALVTAGNIFSSPRSKTEYIQATRRLVDDIEEHLSRLPKTSPRHFQKISEISKACERARTRLSPEIRALFNIMIEKKSRQNLRR